MIKYDDLSRFDFKLNERVERKGRKEGRKRGGTSLRLLGYTTRSQLIFSCSTTVSSCLCLYLQSECTRKHVQFRATCRDLVQATVHRQFTTECNVTAEYSHSIRYSHSSTSSAYSLSITISFSLFLSHTRKKGDKNAIVGACFVFFY